jgi:hypothetical protein
MSRKPVLPEAPARPFRPAITKMRYRPALNYSSTFVSPVDYYSPSNRMAMLRIINENKSLTDRLENIRLKSTDRKLPPSSKHSLPRLFE